MGKLLRELYPDQFFHIIARSNNHIDLFKAPEDFRTFLTIVHQQFRQCKIKCFHYCLMNTHIHLVVQMPSTVKHVPDTIQKINLKYYQYYHNRYNYEGSLWRGRYKSEFIDNDRYMLGCGLYVEHNPVKAGIVRLPEEYPWSSYSHWIGMSNDPLLAEHPLVNSIEDYRTIAKDYIEMYNDYMRLTLTRKIS
jgi:putative transposase